MSKKPRKKKNNVVERKYRLARAFTSSYILARLGNAPVLFVDALNMRILKGSNKLAQCFNKSKHYWTIMLVVGCRESNGKFKMVTDMIGCADRMYHQDLEAFLDQEHQALIEECKKHMKIEYVGWVATTVPEADFELEPVVELFDKLLEKENVR